MAGACGIELQAASMITAARPQHSNFPCLRKYAPIVFPLLPRFDGIFRIAATKTTFVIQRRGFAQCCQAPAALCPRFLPLLSALAFRPVPSARFPRPPPV
ncbi:putative uncharacterized protein [Burkholderiales bacterium GJ-E10]|nr:putative uncharacterized protein [Burkholderiales bacterium GJ-E10]